MSEDLLLESPESYARKLASYIASPIKIENLTRLEFGRAPPLREIAEMRYRIEQSRRPVPTNLKDPDTLDGETFKVRSLIRRERVRVRAEPVRLPERVAPRREPEPEPTELLAAIATEFGLSLDELKNGCLRGTVTRARQTAYAILRAKGHSYPAIARWLGRDHSTVMHGCRNFNRYTPYHPEMRAAFDKFVGEVAE